MQVEREIDSTDRLVVLTVVGEITDPDLLAIAGELEKIPDTARDFALLIDLRRADGSRISATGIRTLAKVPLVLSPESRRAVVVPSEFGFGMARMYEILRDERGAMRVYRDPDEARRWVTMGVP